MNRDIFIEIRFLFLFHIELNASEDVPSSYTRLLSVCITNATFNNFQPFETNSVQRPKPSPDLGPTSSPDLGPTS